MVKKNQRIRERSSSSPELSARRRILLRERELESEFAASLRREREQEQERREQEAGLDETQRELLELRWSQEKTIVFGAFVDSHTTTKWWFASISATTGSMENVSTS